MLYVYIGLYLIIVNVIAYVLMRIDKKRSRRRGARRIPEKLLLGISVIGGSIGAMIAMYTLHHKTRHRRFRYGIPAIAFIQFNILLLIFSTGTAPSNYWVD